MVCIQAIEGTGQALGGHGAAPDQKPNTPSTSGWRVRRSLFETGASVPVHQHAEGQLIFALRGVMQVQADESQWIIPPQRALWMPSTRQHSIRMLSPTEMRSVYIAPMLYNGSSAFRRCREVHAVATSPLIRELVSGLFVERRERLMQGHMLHALLHALDEAACLPVHLPMPSSQRLRTAVSGPAGHDPWRTGLRDAAARAAMSERSFSRHFTAEVGMSFRSWRQRARIVASLDLLASPLSIKEIAGRLDFSDSATFVTAFQELMGSAPGAFRRAGLDG